MAKRSRRRRKRSKRRRRGAGLLGRTRKAPRACARATGNFLNRTCKLDKFAFPTTREKLARNITNEVNKNAGGRVTPRGRQESLQTARECIRALEKNPECVESPSMRKEPVGIDGAYLWHPAVREAQARINRTDQMAKYGVATESGKKPGLVHRVTGKSLFRRRGGARRRTKRRRKRRRTKRRRRKRRRSRRSRQRGGDQCPSCGTCPRCGERQTNCTARPGVQVAPDAAQLLSAILHEHQRAGWQQVRGREGGTANDYALARALQGAEDPRANDSALARALQDNDPGYRALARALQNDEDRCANDSALAQALQGNSVRRGSRRRRRH